MAFFRLYRTAGPGARPVGFEYPTCWRFDPGPAGRFLRQPPYVAVEILSREDRASELDDKIEDYLDFGVENIWVVDPRRLRVTDSDSRGQSDLRRQRWRLPMARSRFR